MFIIITSSSGAEYTVRKNDIKRVYETPTGTVVRFSSPKENPAIFVNGSVQDFYDKYLWTRKGEK